MSKKWAARDIVSKKVPNKKASLLFSLLDTDPPPFRHGAQIIWQIAKLILEFPEGKGAIIFRLRSRSVK